MSYFIICREFLEGKIHYHPRDIDTWDLSQNQSSYKSYLTDEMDCVEQTLTKRRAELREADRLLMECEEDLKHARTEVGVGDIKESMKVVGEGRSKGC